MHHNHLWNKVHHRLPRINRILLVLFSHNTFRERGHESAFMATVEVHTLRDTFVSGISLLHTITTHKQKELLSEGALFVHILFNMFRTAFCHSYAIFTKRAFVLFIRRNFKVKQGLYFFLRYTKFCFATGTVNK